MTLFFKVIVSVLFIVVLLVTKTYLFPSLRNTLNLRFSPEKVNSLILFGSGFSLFISKLTLVTPPDNCS
ncbi:Uncharacterised protein [Chlamydia trachomatis]|nr:Uncharacterised protein [Chlamydia trachomatis]